MRISLSQAEAFTTIPLATQGVDPGLARDDARCIRDLLLAHKGFQALGAYSFGLLIAGLLERLRREPWQHLVTEASGQLSDQQRESAFALACRVIHSDRSVTPADGEFLTALAALIGLADCRQRQIVEVCELLNLDPLIGAVEQGAPEDGA